PQWTFFVPFLWILGFVAVSIWYRRSKDEPIFPRLPDDAEFGEKGCSGRSLKSPLSKIGGASRCLLRVNSIYGNGLFEVGEQEKIYYLRSNPQEARQDSYSNFNMLWLVLGAI